MNRFTTPLLYLPLIQRTFLLHSHIQSISLNCSSLRSPRTCAMAPGQSLSYLHSPTIHVIALYSFLQLLYHLHHSAYLPLFQALLHLYQTLSLILHNPPPSPLAAISHIFAHQTLYAICVSKSRQLFFSRYLTLQLKRPLMLPITRFSILNIISVLKN